MYVLLSAIITSSAVNVVMFSNLLVPVGVPMERQRVAYRVTVYKAEDLPQTDLGLMATLRNAVAIGDRVDFTDPYIQVTFVGLTVSGVLWWCMLSILYFYAETERDFVWQITAIFGQYKCWKDFSLPICHSKPRLCNIKIICDVFFMLCFLWQKKYFDWLPLNQVEKRNKRVISWLETVNTSFISNAFLAITRAKRTFAAATRPCSESDSSSRTSFLRCVIASRSSCETTTPCQTRPLLRTTLNCRRLWTLAETLKVRIIVFSEIRRTCRSLGLKKVH